MESNKNKKQIRSALSFHLELFCYSLFYYLGELLCIGKIIHSNGQEDIQQSVWSHLC